MRRVNPPDTIAFILFAVATAGVILVVAWVVWPLVGSSQWRAAAVSATTLLGGLCPIWWLSGGRGRQQGHLWYYRVRGPTCELEITGTAELDPCDVEDNLVMDRKLEALVGEWRTGAHLSSGDARQGTIVAGPRTVQYNVYTEVDFRDDDEEEDPEPNPRRLQITITGYEGKISKIISDLDGEVNALLGKIADNVASRERPFNWSLSTKLVGRNTFLSYHLQGLRTESVERFQLRVIDKSYGDSAVVRIDDNTLFIGSHNPRALTFCARRYLATPDLANVDPRGIGTN